MIRKQTKSREIFHRTCAPIQESIWPTYSLSCVQTKAVIHYAYFPITSLHLHWSINCVITRSIPLKYYMTIERSKNFNICTGCVLGYRSSARPSQRASALWISTVFIVIASGPAVVPLCQWISQWSLFVSSIYPWYLGLLNKRSSDLRFLLRRLGERHVYSRMIQVDDDGGSASYWTRACESVDIVPRAIFHHEKNGAESLRRMRVPCAHQLP